jgi:hypothetical protein
MVGANGHCRDQQPYVSYVSADYTASFDNDHFDDFSMCEDVNHNRGPEIFKSRPLSSQLSQSSPAISAAPSFGTATTASMDQSLAWNNTDASYEEVAFDLYNNNNSNDSPCNSITFSKAYSMEGEEDRESDSLNNDIHMASPLSSSESEQLYQAPSSETSRELSLYPTKGEKDDVVRHFELQQQQQRCQTPTPFLIVQ